MDRPAGRARAARRAVATLAMRATILTLGTIAGAGLASAHDQSGALGAAASATDYYRISCFDDGQGPPASLALQVRDPAPGDAIKISVQVAIDGGLVNTNDLNDGDALYGPLVTLNGGAAVYQVLVDKNAAGAETYQISYHCYTGPNGTGLHTGTLIVAVQNQ